MMENVSWNLKRAGVCIVLAAAAMFVAACDDDDDDDDDTTISQQDRDFMRNATYGNRAEVELGELAVTRATNEAVRDFAEMMVAEHSTALNELDTIADDLDYDLPDGLREDHEEIKDDLDDLTGATFDSAYMASQVMMHEESEMLFESEANNGDAKRLKDYANKYLPGIRMHLHKADSIADTLTQ